MTNPDITKIKQRIIDTIKSKNELYDTDSEDKSKLRDVRLGFPDGGKFEGLQYPIAFVTNADNFHSRERYGAVVDNQVTAPKHAFNFEIYLFGMESNSSTLEESLDKLYRLIFDAMDSNSSLSDPIDKKDPVAKCSFTTGGKSFSSLYKGKNLDGRIIRITVTAIDD